MVEVAITANSRVFLMEGGAGPSVAPVYEGLWRAGAVSWEQGDITRIQIPSASQRGKFDRVGSITGEQGDPEIGITARFAQDAKSVLLRLSRNTCENDLQIHFGKCRDPKDFSNGWRDGKILVLEDARPSSYGTDELGALQSDENAAINEETTFVGSDYYEIVPIKFSQLASDEVVQEVVGIEVCDSETCGACGIPSNGCSVVFAVTMRAGGSPGQGAEVVATQDGGSTWVDRIVTTITGSDDPTGLACIGDNVVVISNESESLHYAASADVLNEDETWTEITTGFVAAKGPNAIWSNGPSLTWIVGDGGYIYFTSDPTSGVEVQDSGSATTENLNDIDGLDSDRMVAVGDNNAVVYTTNGGETWTSVTGPAVGVNLNAVVMHTATEWFVGTAAGTLWYTRNSGETWTQKGFPGSGAGVIRDIKFASKAVGYMSHDTATPAGRILRTIDGGYSWYVLPEGTGSITANDRINALAVCQDVNIVYGAGLADNAVDGVIVKGA